jgi:hypothetical protein
MEFGLHRPSAWDSPLPPLGECHREANPQEAVRWGRPARRFGRPATPWAHWSVAFAHCLLMSGTPPVWHLFWWNSKFPCNFLKCSNLTPMFLKSNKHQNRGTRLVDKVNTWLFYTFTRHVGTWNWCFMSANTSPKLELLLVLEQNQTWSNARNLRQHKCRPILRLTRRINAAIPCGSYLPHGAFVEFFTLS